MITIIPFDSDSFVCKYMKVEYSNATKKKGAGIFVEITSASWIPKGYIVFAIAAEKKHYAMAINPF